MSPCRSAIFALALLAIAFLSGCNKSESYTGIALTDTRLAEFNDLLSVDRATLGIPALPTSGNVKVERHSGKGQTYDVMLHVYAYAQHQARTIAFRREDGKLKWIHEQVVIYGPQKYTTVDGTFDEHITLTYETSRVADSRLNHLNVAYSGPDAVLSRKYDPPLADVQPLLDQWLQRP